MNINFLNNIKNNCGNYIAKGIGAAAIGICGYDAHVMGKLQSDVYAQSNDANAMNKAFSNTMYLSNPSMSTDKMKKEVFRFEAESNYRNFFNSGIGYFKGLGSMLVRDAIPITMGLVAVMSKGVMSKCSAIGLAAYAGVSFLKDGLGMGQNDPLNQKF
ncbi:MAG: hypothetical protein R3Y28_05130 [Candidatus Gastranaerophilales bacterium]